MPPVNENLLLATDAILQAFGLLILGGWALAAVRHGTWRAPNQLGQPAGRPFAWLVLLLLFVAFALGQSTFVELRHFSVADLEDPAGRPFVELIGFTGALQIVLGVGGLLWLARTARVVQPGLPTSPGWGRALLGGVAAGLVSIPLTMFVESAALAAWEWLAPSVLLRPHVVLQSVQSNSNGGLANLALTSSAVLAAPLFEETCFRGLLLGWLTWVTRRPMAALVITSIAFGLTHSANPETVPPLILFGLILGLVRLRWGLGAAIVTHALFNARSMALVLLNPDLLH